MCKEILGRRLKPLEFYYQQMMLDVFFTSFQDSSMTHPTRQRERLVKRFKEVGDGEDWARGDQKDQ